MQRQIEHMRRFFARTPRFFACLVACVCLVSVMSPMVMAVNVVTVADEEDGEELVLLTSTSHPVELMQQAGVVPTGEGMAQYAIVNEGATKLNRDFVVTLLADGDVYTGEFYSATVADLLAETGVELEGEDYTTYPLDAALEEGMQVAVHRVTYLEETQEAVELDEQTVDAYLATLPEDVVFKKSYYGTYNATYLHRMDNGEITDSELLALHPIFGVREQGVTDFIEGLAISRIEGFEDVELGIDGLPTEYSRLMEGAVTTAYSASAGKGASGLGLYYGTVAVNPAVIPYGSRLYITSADGKFVYGFAIATDTGSALREGYVDIDLFFETNAECLRFGKRGLNVYILD